MGSGGRKDSRQHLGKSRSPVGSAGKESACKAGDAGNTGLIPGLGRSTGGGNGNPLQYACLENPWTEETGGLWPIGPQRIRHD